MATRYETRPLTDLTAVSQNTEVTTNDLTGAQVWVTGTFVGTVQPEITPDGTNWVALGSALTGPGIVAVPVGARGVRGNCTAFTSGTISMVVSGQR